MKYLLAFLASLALGALASAAFTSGTWMCPGSGQPVDIEVRGSGTGMTVTITHGGQTVTVGGLEDPNNPGRCVEFPSPGTSVEVGGMSFRARIPLGKPQFSERPEGFPWFNMPKNVPASRSSVATGDGEGTLPGS